VRLELSKNVRELALFSLGLDSKLRGCDLVSLRVRDIAHGLNVQARAKIVQKKTGRPVQFEITEQSREAVKALIEKDDLDNSDYLFKSRIKESPHLSTRQYSRIVDGWIRSIGLEPTNYGAHSMRRTKPSLIYRKTKNIRACQLLLGHTKLESTVRYLDIEVDDALEISESIDI
jgi:integrase